MNPRVRQCVQYKGGYIDFRDPTVLGSFNFDTHLQSVPVTFHVELELLQILLKQYCDSQVTQLLPSQVYTTDIY